MTGLIKNWLVHNESNLYPILQGILQSVCKNAVWANLILLLVIVALTATRIVYKRIKTRSQMTVADEDNQLIVTN